MWTPRPLSSTTQLQTRLEIWEEEAFEGLLGLH